MFSRRGFVKLGAASIASMALRRFGLLPALAQSSPADYRALVCVFLFGGNDSNNMVVPVDDTSFQQYTSIRGNLALSSSDLTSPVYAGNNAPYAFHAGLTEVASLFSNKELAVVANVGTLVQPTTRAGYQSQSTPLPVNLFSHSDQQLQWQTSIPSGHSATGWAGRAADLMASQNASTFPTFLSVAGNSLLGEGTNTQPIALAPGQSLDLKGFTTSAASQARREALENLLTLDTGVKLAQASNSVMSNSIADAQALDNALSKTSLQTTFPKTSLGAQLQQIAQIIQARDGLGMRRQIFFASLGGFDTHSGELNTLRMLYPQLSQALAAFQDALAELGVQNQVTTFTESDFSRTFQPTSSDGSDHAWGSHHLVMGGAVRGRNIYGQFPEFALGGPDDADVRGRWIPTTAIDQYGATLCSWFGVQDSDLVKVFPNFPNFGSAKLGFV
ncbi:MAG TPA: DUF1501 domain-containing protein [Bryobacteraceae bacterium]|jgi:uncharacterized protein (DUF1501 family)|nr:DUF1501 domain-containing protein [Bryobacteraceae bacterium]